MLAGLKCHIEHDTDFILFFKEEIKINTFWNWQYIKINFILGLQFYHKLSILSYFVVNPKFHYFVDHVADHVVLRFHLLQPSRFPVGARSLRYRRDKYSDFATREVAVVLESAASLFSVALNYPSKMRMSVLGDALKTLANAEKRGKRQVLLRPSSKVIIKVLQVMQSHGKSEEIILSLLRRAVYWWANFSRWNVCAKLYGVFAACNCRYRVQACHWKHIWVAFVDTGK